MKKLGFTLAEILIALTIIGVVAALSIPTFIINVRSAETGPRLAAAALAFERANERYLDDNFQSKLYNEDGFGDQPLIKSGINECERPGGYINSLEVYLGGTCEKVKHFYQININSGLQYLVGNMSTFLRESEDLPPHEQQFGGNSYFVFDDDVDDGDDDRGLFPYITAVSLVIVLKGEKFYFSLWNDGTIKPLGGTNWTLPLNNNDCEETETKEGGNCHWTTQCKKDSIPGNVMFCAGHIFENGLKRLYK